MRRLGKRYADKSSMTPGGDESARRLKRNAENQAEPTLLRRVLSGVGRVNTMLMTQLNSTRE